MPSEQFPSGMSPVAQRQWQPALDIAPHCFEEGIVRVARKELAPDGVQAQRSRGVIAMDTVHDLICHAEYQDRGPRATEVGQDLHVFEVHSFRARRAPEHQLIEPELGMFGAISVRG
jgi:hypothetical protein